MIDNSIVVFSDDTCIYHNKAFWTARTSDAPEYYEQHEIKDIFGNIVPFDTYYNQFSNNEYAMSELSSIADEVKYNIDTGKEFIAPFREEFVRTPLKEMSSLEIAQKTASLIPLILTGSFREACVLLSAYEPDEFMTEERIQKYIAMLTAADVIEYDEDSIDNK